MENKSEKAKQYFLSGANCAQAVLAAFAPECGLDEKTALKLASGFGGGIAKMREVCGAVSGMVLAADAMAGYTDLDNPAAKDAHYALIQRLAGAFRQETGSIICRELLIDTETTPGGEPEARTKEYYERRPCICYVEDAARLIAEALNA